MSPEPQNRPRGSLLGVVAFVLVPGERRRRAVSHFRRAGFEVFRGVRELSRLEKPSEAVGRREWIEIE